MTPNCSGTCPVSIARNARSVGLARSITGSPWRETLSVIAVIAPTNDSGTRWTRARSHPLSGLTDVSHFASAWRLCSSFRAALEACADGAVRRWRLPTNGNRPTPGQHATRGSFVGHRISRIPCSHSAARAPRRGRMPFHGRLLAPIRRCGGAGRSPGTPGPRSLVPAPRPAHRGTGRRGDCHAHTGRKRSTGHTIGRA
jgi:hypothetical protein